MQELLELFVVDKPFVTSPYGYRRHPHPSMKGKILMHNGIDLISKKKQAAVKLYAPFDGEIIEAAYDEENGSGNYIKIKSKIGNDEYIFSFCHLRENIPELKGKKVSKGEWCAVMGKSGRSTAVHLHLTIRKNKEIIDPLSAFKLVG